MVQQQKQMAKCREQRPSLQANSHSASLEIRHFYVIRRFHTLSDYLHLLPYETNLNSQTLFVVYVIHSDPTKYS